MSIRYELNAASADILKDFGIILTLHYDKQSLSEMGGFLCPLILITFT